VTRAAGLLSLETIFGPSVSGEPENICLHLHPYRTIGIYVLKGVRPVIEVKKIKKILVI
jgi:hypothetical protein